MITIIVLLILAGISISMLSGDNSILQKATETKIQAGVGQEKETIALAYNSALTKKVSNGNSNAVTASELNDELNNSEATASGNPIIVTFIKSENTYEIDSNGIIEEITPINWEQAKANATKHPEQSSTNGDIGIGTDGKPVNMDLWYYTVINDNEIGLYNYTAACGTYIKRFAYRGELINGEIKGKVPQFIKIDGQDEFYEVKSIESGFYNMGGLRVYPDLPSGLTSIGKYAFGDNDLLEDVFIPNHITEIEEGAFLHDNGITSIYIPDGVRVIGKSAFQGSANLETVVLPDTINSMGWGAFGECFKLTSIKFPKNITQINGYMCGSNTNLTDVIIQEGVTSIGDQAFTGCRNLNNITIPKSTTSIGNNAFYGCTSLSTVTFTGTKAQWGSITKGNNNTPLTNATITCSDGVY